MYNELIKNSDNLIKVQECIVQKKAMAIGYEYFRSLESKSFLKKNTVLSLQQ